MRVRLLLCALACACACSNVCACPCARASMCSKRAPFALPLSICMCAYKPAYAHVRSSNHILVSVSFYVFASRHPCACPSRS
eukprot:1849677-Pleurochrysis_carterae.AAC.1